MRKLNKLLRQAQQSCSRLLVSHCHRGPCVVTYSDAAWAVRRKGESQAGYPAGLADAEFLTGQKGALSLVSWHRGRCQRIGRCSLSTEAQAASEAQEEEEYVRLVIVDLLFQDANMWERKRADRTLARGHWLWIAKRCLTVSPGANQVHTACQTSGQHLKPRLSRSPCSQRSEAQLADVITTSSGPGRTILEEFMRRDRWRIIF